MKRFLTWFLSPGGAFIGLGALTWIWRLGAHVWQWLSDVETAHALWVDAGGTMPGLVGMVSSMWFSPALIIAGFVYTTTRWKVDATKRGRAYGQLVDKVGWSIFAAMVVLVLATILFDTFLSSSGASDFAQYVKNQRIERHLKQNEAERIVLEFKKADPSFDFTVLAIDQPEAITYGREFMVAFLLGGQTINGKNFQAGAPFNIEAPLSARLYSASAHGVFIGIPNGEAPSEEAKRFKSTLHDAGFETEYIGWDGLPSGKFNFVIGPH